MQNKMPNQNPTSDKPIYKAAWALYVKMLPRLLPTLFNFAMIGIAVLAVGILLSPSLILTVPFVFIPFFFALEMSDGYLHKGTEITGAQFYRYYAAYYNPAFFGSYGLIRNILYSFLAAIIGGALISSISYGIFTSISPDFVTALEKALDSLQTSDTTTFDTLMTTAPLLQWTITVDVGELGVFSLFFTHFLGRAGILPFLRSVLSGGNSSMVNAVYSGTLRRIHSSYNKDYYSSLWPGYLLFIGGFVLGAYVGSLFTTDSGTIWVSGLAGSFVFLLFYIPYYLQVIGLLLDKYKTFFAAYSMSLASKALSDLEAAQRMAQEEEKAMKNALEEAKKKKEENESNPDNNDDDNNNDDDGNNGGGSSSNGSSSNGHSPDEYGQSDHH